MKKCFKLFVLLFILVVVVRVKADMGAPAVVKYDIIVTNKDGAACYEYNNGKYVKKNESIPYGKIAYTYSEVSGKYLELNYDGDDGYSNYCIVSINDIAPKDSKFNLNSTEINKLKPVKAVILANGGLNMRKGPSTLYARITTIPKGAVVTLKYNAGTFWYYADYNGSSGWISGINQYLGYNNDEVLISYNDVEIKDKSNKKIGTIPALTEITDYVKLVSYDGPSYYVNYKGTVGYVDYMPSKVEGKIKLKQDENLYNGKKIVKKISKGTTLDYNITSCEDYIEGDNYCERCTYYIPSENGNIVTCNGVERVGEEIEVKKLTGFIGEGLFGEAKQDKIDRNDGTTYQVEEQVDINDINNENNNSNNENDVQKRNTLSNEMIIICVLGTIVLSLTIVVIILLVNSKKKKKEEVKGEEKKEFEKREVVENKE